MPNPPHSAREMPFDEALGFATHVEIICGGGYSYGGCGHSKRVLARELFEACGRPETLAEARKKLRCEECGMRGWAGVKPLGR